MFFALVQIFDMYVLLFCSAMFWAFLIWNVTFVLGEPDSYAFHKPFNCGFDVNPRKLSQRHNLRQFVVGILFLIFDVELVLLLPISLGASEADGFSISSFFVFFVVLTDRKSVV